MSEPKYNSDELVPPSFLNEQFVVDLIKSVEKDPEVEVSSYEIKPGSSAGDHYASIMFKIIATYTSKGKEVSARRFILKTMPEVECEKKEMLKDMPVFDNEIRMYSEVLPAMQTILNQHNEKGWWPTLVYFSKDPLVLVFDDLTQQDFGMVYEPLDMDNIGIVLEKISKYHALSMVIGQSDDPKTVTQFVGSFDGEVMRPLFQAMMTQSQKLGKAVSSWPGLEQIGVKIQNNTDKYFDNFAAFYQSAEVNSWKVLNHGDFHIRNMMFRKNEQGVVNDVTFLDFQIPLYLSPGFDLAYMMNMIGNRDVRVERRSEVIKRYHELLVKSLALYGFTGKVPSVIDVNIEMLKIAPFDVFQCLCFLPVFQLDLTGMELGELFNKSEGNPMSIALEKLYTKPSFIEEMKKILYYFDNLGVLD